MYHRSWRMDLDRGMTMTNENTATTRSWYMQVRSRFGKPHVSLMSDSHDSVPAADHPSHSVAALLGTIPTLRFVKPAGLRALAETTTHQQVQVGEAVTRQGEHSDAVFLIIDGTFEVLISHVGHTPDFIRILKTGDSFGELGVLYDVPRTATIRCASPGHLLRIPGDAFLDSLETGS